MLKELRQHERLKVKRLPGVLLNAATQESIPCEAIDVSKHGLGIVSSLWVPPQLDVLLIVGSLTVKLEIVWGIEEREGPAWARKDEPRPQERIYRYGLRLCQPDGDVDLMDIFQKEGCFT